MNTIIFFYRNVGSYLTLSTCSHAYTVIYLTHGLIRKVNCSFILHKVKSNILNSNLLCFHKRSMLSLYGYFTTTYTFLLRGNVILYSNLISILSNRHIWVSSMLWYLTVYTRAHWPHADSYRTWFEFQYSLKHKRLTEHENN